MFENKQLLDWCLVSDRKTRSKQPGLFVCLGMVNNHFVDVNKLVISKMEHTS